MIFQIVLRASNGNRSFLRPSSRMSTIANRVGCQSHRGHANGFVDLQLQDPQAAHKSTPPCQASGFHAREISFPVAS